MTSLLALIFRLDSLLLACCLLKFAIAIEFAMED